jgi:hypothetical protein
VSPDATTNEIALVERHVRVSLLPLVFTEFLSVALPIAALLSAGKDNVPLFAALGLALLSRGQVDTPLRSLELVIAALAGLTWSRAVRVPERREGAQSSRERP